MSYKQDLCMLIPHQGLDVRDGTYSDEFEGI